MFINFNYSFNFILYNILYQTRKILRNILRKYINGIELKECQFILALYVLYS